MRPHPQKETPVPQTIVPNRAMKRAAQHPDAYRPGAQRFTRRQRWGLEPLHHTVLCLTWFHRERKERGRESLPLDEQEKIMHDRLMQRCREAGYGTS